MTSIDIAKFLIYYKAFEIGGLKNFHSLPAGGTTIFTALTKYSFL